MLVAPILYHLAVAEIKSIFICSLISYREISDFKKENIPLNSIEMN